MTTADEEPSKGTGFMSRLKRRWNTEKKRVSKHNLRDNATIHYSTLE